MSPEELEARVWNDDALIREALNEFDSLPYFIRQIRDERDPMIRGERMWDLIERCVQDQARAMHDEQAEYEADAAHESRMIDQANAVHINRMFGS